MKEAPTLHAAPMPIGPYSPVVRTSGDLYFFSGQIALSADATEIVGSTAAEQTERICTTLVAMLKELGLSIDNVVKTTVFLRSMDDFASMNAVYERYFGTSKPARSTVEVSRLPKGALVEIEIIAVR
ncbi:MAG: Rid family detoxifying hydrolase [Chlorobi bacterium]|nr:Rid family detoxifying hydrolase [Chlorobiota bacterium]